MKQSEAALVKERDALKQSEAALVKERDTLNQNEADLVKKSDELKAESQTLGLYSTQGLITIINSDSLSLIMILYF